MNTVRTRLVQMEVVPGAPRVNTQQLLAAIALARADGVALVVFPELAISGCLLGDEWERSAFLRECETCGELVREASQGLVVVFGNVAVDWTLRNEDGRVRKYNALFFAEDGRWLTLEGCNRPYAVKTLQPNYREFDDSRHFFDTRRLALELGIGVNQLLAPVTTKYAGRLGGMLCEDAWDGDYATSPGRMLAAKGAERLIVASCSPFTRGKPSKRYRVLSTLAQATQVPVLYVNNIGVQDVGKTVYTFDGGNGIYDCRGQVIEGVPSFETGALTWDVPGGAVPFGRASTTASGDGVAEVAQALLYGTTTFMQRLGIRRVVVGVSGGIDSAVVAALYGRLVSPENLLLVSMPGPFTSQTTRGLARKLAENLGSRFAEIPIGAGVELTQRQFAELQVEGPQTGLGTLSLNGAALENVQARDRGSRILAAAAAAFGGVVTCNANKSEITVGYGTLYGDILGWLAMIGDLWKGEVYELGHHLNAVVYQREVIPQGSFDIVPSAELSQAQAVEQGLGDPLVYPYHDCLFRAWVERWERATPEDILEWYLDGVLEKQIGYTGCLRDLFPDAASFIADLERWWNLHQGLAVAKRLQAPPILAVSRRAFGFDLREAQLGPRYTERYSMLRKKACS